MTRTVVVVMGLLLAARTAAAQLTYEGSLSGSTGTYLFTERTTSLVLNNGLSFRTGRLTLRASLPFWYQNTTLVTSSGSGSIPTGGPYGQETVRDSGQARQQQGQGGNGPGGNGQGPGGPGGGAGPGGPGGANPVVAPWPSFATGTIPAPGEALTGYQFMLADPMATATVRVVQASRVNLSLGGTVKFPLADTARIGTGQWDFGGQASISVLVGDRWTLGLDAAYWHLGDLDSLDLVDPLLGSLSVGTLIGDSWGAIFSVAAGTRTLTGFDPPVTLMAALSRFGTPASWGINVGAGLTETAPDFTIGATWWVKLW
jgi:hypothetical protein